MFPSRYFAGSYYPRRYFPALGGLLEVVAQAVRKALAFVPRRSTRPRPWR